LVLQPGPAGRLWAELFHLPGRRTAAPYGDGARVVAAARSLAGRGVHQSSGRGVGPAFCAGDPLPFAAPAARAPGGSALGALPGAARPAQFANQSAPPDGGTFTPPLCQERLPLRRLSTPLSTPALGVNQTAPAVPDSRPPACLPASHALRATNHLGSHERAVGLIRNAGPCRSW